MADVAIDQAARAEAIRRSDEIRIQVFKLLVDFDPPEPKSVLDPFLIRARNFFIAADQRLTNKLLLFESIIIDQNRDTYEYVNAQHEAAQAAGDKELLAGGAHTSDSSEASETSQTPEAPEAPRAPPAPEAYAPPTLCAKRRRERPPAPPFVQYAIPMLLPYDQLMATPPGELVGRLVRLWRPDMELLAKHAYARVLAYEPELDLHELAWLFDETVREEVCFRVMDPNAVQLVVQEPADAFMVSLQRHQLKRQRVF
jgi:hypothetical protein